MMKRLFLLLCLAGIAFSFQMNLNASSLPKYLVIYDLDKDDCQYRYTDEEPDLDDDVCRTTELWLRYIPEGEFKMGSPASEVGHKDAEVQHRVTLTKPFYIGVFECTQAQWKHIMGDRPSYFNNNLYYATRPVENVSYTMIRGAGAQAGAGWPMYGHAVDASSFMGVLRDKTGLMFDLPTEAQWEYACRAGTTKALNSDENLESTSSDAYMDEVGRYWFNGGEEGYDNPSCGTEHGTAKVGSYKPNNWGLYDMHGNAYEWCLDWNNSAYSSEDVTDPVGDTTGTFRVRRGGNWNVYAHDCRSAVRNGDWPGANNNKYTGFRIVCLPIEKFAVTVVNGTADKTEAAEGETVTITINEPPSGKVFDSWTGNVEFANATATETTFVMPANDVTVTANYYKKGTRYLVIYDLDKDDWQYRYTDNEPDLTKDACRTTELWLRYIPEGTFTMGSPTDELGRWDDETQHKVTLTKPFYIGVFECTQAQWEYVMGKGKRPSYFNNDDYYATRPVEQVSYNMIRGAETGASWPSSDAVDAASFMGVLRDKTGLKFDLPTEAQWEYACRAGTKTALNSGKNLENRDEDDNMAKMGRYYYNGGYVFIDGNWNMPSEDHDTANGTAKVGGYLPNAWGLYDMHGNVWEYCLDWWNGSAYNPTDATDPVGDTTASFCVVRGGSWRYDACYCRSAKRTSIGPYHNTFPGTGFRIVCLSLPPTYAVTVVKGTADKTEATEGETVAITANMPASGQTFDKWTGNVEFANETAVETTFEMPANAVTVTATFKKLPAVKTYKIVVVNGTADKAKAAAGETVTLTAKPAPAGKVFDKWTGGAVFADPKAMETTFVMPAKAVTPKAIYKKK